MSSEASLLKEKFDELKLTEDEVKRFTEALKKEEFRKLLVEYAQEISDPENRKLYEQEIEQLENERGVDVTFINPEPGFVLKTAQNGDLKCFINICMNKNIKPPTSEITSRKDTETGVDKKGMTWSIPHSCSPPRDDLDKTGKKCLVYDVVFHPDSYRMAETNKRFKQLIQDTAIETIETNFKVKIDKANVKHLNMKFKGRPTATVIRKPKGDATGEVKNTEPQDDLMNKVKTPYKYPPSAEGEEKKLIEEVKTAKEETKAEDEYEQPKYTIINRGHADIQDCANELKQVVNSTRPNELIVEIDLPLCKSAAQVKLDIFEKRLYLESQKPNYKLDLNLSYPVDENNGNAKFDKTKRKLVVTLPVMPLKIDFEETQTKSLVEPIETELTPPNTPPPAEEVEETTTFYDDDETVNSSDSGIKHVLPENYRFEQNSTHLKLKFNTKNFNEKSFTISLAAKSVAIKYETVSNGGYVTYYSVFLAFPSDLIDVSSSYKVEHKNVYTEDEFVLIRLKKTCSTSMDKAALLSIDSKQDNQMAVIFESCEEEELKEALETIANEQKLASNSTQVKFTLGSNNSKDMFNVSIQNTGENGVLDEDDDQDEEEEQQVKQELETVSEVTEMLNNQVEQEQENSNQSSSDSLENSNSSLDLNSHARQRKLKSILKKPRSYSEGESNHEMDSLTQSSSSTGSGSISIENSLETISEKESKKSVKFNQQIVRKVFKIDSAITEMKKPSHSAKNRKRNQRRKRTVSDTTHDGKDSKSSNRNRSTSESSDDGHHHGLTASSEEDLHDHGDHAEQNNDDDDEEEQHEDNKKAGDAFQSQKTKLAEMDRHPSNKSNNKPVITSTEETILSWKKEETRNNEKTKCAFKFTNKIINELDD